MKRRDLLLFLLVLVACTSCDQAAKQLAEDVLRSQPPISLLGDGIRLELVGNRGAFLGLGAQLPEALRFGILIVAVPLALLVLCVAFFRQGRRLSERVFLGLVAGGGIGNWLDRLFQDGVVTDFVSLGVGPLRTGIFNLADVAVIVGALGLVCFATVWPDEDADAAGDGSASERAA